MDISSDMINGLLPVFLTSVLGATAEMVGLIEGVGEATHHRQAQDGSLPGGGDHAILRA